VVSRILKILADISPRRSVAVAFDLTRPTEHIVRGTARELREQLPRAHGREVTFILAGRDGTEWGGQHARRAQSLSSRRIKTR
jgi:16S rRNA C1402 (ribose-2'-O) methylase RsmI